MNNNGGVACADRRTTRHERDAEFQRLVEETRARHNISDLIGRYTDLKRAGPRELVGLCPFHKERTPSFRVNDSKGTYYCFGCGRSGDHIRFIMERENVGFLAALRYLGASDLPTVSAEERTRRIEAQSAEDDANRKAAIAFFAEAGQIEGTQGEAYLRARGITAMPRFAGTVRFAMAPSWRNTDTGEWGRKRPALVCVCQDTGGNLTGIQRIFVDGERPDKAAVKLTLGRIRGSALRLDKPQAEVIVTEGPEDGLSIRQMHPETPVFVSCGTGLLPFIGFPPEVRSIIIAGQNDDPGRAAADAAATAYIERGLEVRCIFPSPEYRDWNDELRRRAA
jgi:DNA primase